MGTCPGSSSLRTNDAGRIVAQCLSICTSSYNYYQHHNHYLYDELDDFRWSRTVGSAGDEDIETYCSCPSCRCPEDDCSLLNSEDMDDYETCGSRLSLPQRLALLRHRTSVDLDA